jgi:bifunctional DNase/RNase
VPRVIRMQLVGVRVEVPSNQPIVLLRESDGERYLPIFIGSPEATAIVHALQELETPRPMTHDLFKHVLELQRTRLRRVDITELHEGTFHAAITLDQAGAELRVDSRPSDAIALAVRFGIDSVEIWADDSVIAEAGVELPNVDEGEEPASTEAEVEQFRHFLEHITPEDFA